MAKDPTPVRIEPAMGGQLRYGMSAQNAGAYHYHQKRDWRRLLDREVRREGHDYFYPVPGVAPGNQMFPWGAGVTDPITLLIPLDGELIAGTDDTIKTWNHGIYKGPYSDPGDLPDDPYLEEDVWGYYGFTDGQPDDFEGVPDDEDPEVGPDGGSSDDNDVVPPDTPTPDVPVPPQPDDPEPPTPVVPPDLPPLPYTYLSYVPNPAEGVYVGSGYYWYGNQKDEPGVEAWTRNIANEKTKQAVDQAKSIENVRRIRVEEIGWMYYASVIQSLSGYMGFYHHQDVLMNMTAVYDYHYLVSYVRGPDVWVIDNRTGSVVGYINYDQVEAGVQWI